MPVSSTFPTDNQYIKYRIVVTESNISIANNTSTVNVRVDAWRTNSGYTTSGTGTCYCYFGGVRYSQSISASQEIKYNSHTVLFNRTFNNVAHNSDGSKNIYISAKIDHQRFDSSYHGFTVSLSKIPRQANIVSVWSFDDEGIPLFSYSNPAGDAVDSLRACISLTESPENPIVAFRNISKFETIYEFNDLTTAERNALRASTPNSNSLQIFYIVETVIAGVTYYSTGEAVMLITDANPEASGITYADNNSATTAITLNPQLIIQNKSTVNFNFSSIMAQKFADLVSITISINSITKTFAVAGSSVIDKNCYFGEIDSASNQTAEIVITDSRGNSQNYSVSILMLEWHIPTAIIKASRVSNYYSQTIIMADADYSSLDGKNVISITWEYKERTSSTYIYGGTLTDAQPITFNLDNEKKWDLKITVADRIDSKVYNAVVEIGIPIVFWDRNLRSLGINKFPSNSGTLENHGKLYQDDDLIFTDSGTNTRQIKGVVGGSDAFRIAGGATASDQGFMELATAGDGDEPIFARQYSGDYANLLNEIILMDANGKTTLKELNVSNGITANNVKIPHEYSSTEHIVGKWIDGSPVYEITYMLQSSINVPSNSTTTIFTYNQPILPLSCEAYRIDASFATTWEGIGILWANAVISFVNSGNTARQIDAFTMKYVKTS